MHQSIAVLSSYGIQDGELDQLHDYPDDLESFFYILLSELMLSRAADGAGAKKAAQGALRSWAARDDTKAQYGKTCFIGRSFNAALADIDYWGNTCVELLGCFHDV